MIEFEGKPAQFQRSQFKRGKRRILINLLTSIVKKRGKKGKKAKTRQDKRGWNPTWWDQGCNHGDIMEISWRYHGDIMVRSLSDDVILRGKKKKKNPAAYRKRRKKKSDLISPNLISFLKGCHGNSKKVICESQSRLLLLFFHLKKISSCQDFFFQPSGTATWAKPLFSISFFLI